LGLAGCDDAVQSTDLRSEGPPDVLAVLVMTDAVSGLVESATYCRPNDEKRPSQVGLPDFTTTQVCPAELSEAADEVTNALPDGWYVRIMFDELLDPEIETLTEIIDPDTGEATDTYVGSIATTKPVTLECESVNGGMVEVDYDGYYSPSGNRITWPLGPSLVVKPNDPTLIATASQCEITINDNVTDKAGNPVAADQRGPYKFSVAPIEVLAIEPEDGSEVDAAITQVDGVFVQFNTFVDPDSFCDEGAGTDCEFEFTPAEGGVDYDNDDLEHYFFTANPAKVETDYTFSFIEGTKIKDRCGKEMTFGAPSEANGTKISFTTNPFALNGASISTGETASMMKKVILEFSNIIDATSVSAADYTITPTPTSSSLVADGNALLLEGYFDVDTEYTFTLNAGAVIADANGAMATIEEAETITWKTQPAISATFSPSDNGTITKSTSTSAVGVTIGFNAPMKGTAADLVEDTEYTFESGGTAVTGFTVAPKGCGVSDTSCAVTITKDLAPGTYTFTLKMGATLEDQLGNVYTQAADKVIHFTVEAPEAPEPTPACL
jgi:hypothetical protein